MGRGSGIWQDHQQWQRKFYFPGRKYDFTMRGWEGEIVEYRVYSAGMHVKCHYYRSLVSIVKGISLM